MFVVFVLLTSIKLSDKTMAVVTINGFLMVNMVVIPVLAIKKILNTDRNFKQCYEPIVQSQIQQT